MYGKLAPLRPVKIESHDGTTTRRHFSGWVQSIHPAANKNGERTAAIQVAGAMQFLKATETKIELQENQRSDEIIDRAHPGSHLPAGAVGCLGPGRSGLQQAGYERVSGLLEIESAG